MGMGESKREHFPPTPLDWIDCSLWDIPSPRLVEGILGLGPLYVQLRYNKGPSFKNTSETNRHSEYQF